MNTPDLEYVASWRFSILPTLSPVLTKPSLGQRADSRRLSPWKSERGISWRCAGVPHPPPRKPGRSSPCGMSAMSTCPRAASGKSSRMAGSSTFFHPAGVSAPENTALPRFAARHVTFEPSRASSRTGSERRYTPSSKTTSAGGTRSCASATAARIRRSASRAPAGVASGFSFVPGLESFPAGETCSSIGAAAPAAAARTAHITAMRTIPYNDFI